MQHAPAARSITSTFYPPHHHHQHTHLGIQQFLVLSSNIGIGIGIVSIRMNKVLTSSYSLLRRDNHSWFLAWWQHTSLLIVILYLVLRVLSSSTLFTFHNVHYWSLAIKILPHIIHNPQSSFLVASGGKNKNGRACGGRW